jgi:hypothetical protein
VFLTTHSLLHGRAEPSFPAVLPRHRPDGPSQRRRVKSERVGPDPLGQYLVYVWALIEISSQVSRKKKEISSQVEKEFVVYLKMNKRTEFLVNLDNG